VNKIIFRKNKNATVPTVVRIKECQVIRKTITSKVGGVGRGRAAAIALSLFVLVLPLQ
jgi:hypothetical protein